MSEIQSKKQKIKDTVTPFIVISIVVSLSVWSFWSLQDPTNQFEYAKARILDMELECGEGFDGIKYGYTGEIFYKHGLFEGFTFYNTMSDEQVSMLSQMIISKLSSLPCYDNYLEWSELPQQKIGDVSEK